MNRQFETPEPIELYVEIGKGKVEVRATSTTTTTLDVEGQYADEVDRVLRGQPPVGDRPQGRRRVVRRP